MNFKKIILFSLFALLSLKSSIFAQNTTLSVDKDHASLIHYEQEQQLILINQHIQKECSQQIDLLTAILQHIMGGIQRGSIATSQGKTELLKKISHYLKHSHQLQNMSVLAAQEDILINSTIILKNIIDRLTIAIDSNFEILDDPTVEDLLIPDKGFIASLDYIFSILEKNKLRLDTLSQKSTSLGLTQTNKIIRSLEHFVSNHKWPLIAATSAAALGYGWLTWTSLSDPSNAHSETKGSVFLSTLHDYKAAIQQEKTWRDNFNTPTIVAGIMSSLFHSKLSGAGEVIVNSSLSYLRLKYRTSRSKLKDFYDNLKGIKSLQRENWATPTENSVKLDDPSLIGLEDQKTELYKILDYLRDPELYIRSDNEIAKCCLLIGPSRTGKTAVAKAMAATINDQYIQMGTHQKIEFIEINYSMITNIASLKQFIEYAQANAPSILFIDEIHLLGLQKTGNRELLNEFLTQLTELHNTKNPLKQVFIIGATNHPELLAPELFKHERFGRVIRFKKPGIRDRRNFFTSSFEKYGINPEGIELNSLVLQTKDCDYGHLQQIIKEARFEARSQGRGVSQQHLQRSINNIVHGINTATELSKEESRIAAIDQAGKIVVHHKLEINETIHLATISKVDGKIEEGTAWWFTDRKDDDVIPIRYGTLISTSNREDIPYTDIKGIEKLCKRYIGGIAAQKLILGTYHIDYTAQDYKTAFELAQKIILRGLNLKTLPPEQQNKVFSQTQELLDSYETEVYALLGQHTSLIETLATELLKNRCITGKQINSIVK